MSAPTEDGCKIRELNAFHEGMKAAYELSTSPEHVIQVMEMTDKYASANINHVSHFVAPKADT